MSDPSGNHAEQTGVSDGPDATPPSTEATIAGRSPPPDRELLDDGYPRWVVIRSAGTSGAFHRNVGTVDDPEPACCAVIRRDNTHWRRVEREYYPFEEPCTQPGCFGDPDDQGKITYSVTSEQCAHVNRLAETTELSWREIAHRAGVTLTSAQLHAKERCWHETGRNNVLDD